MDRISALPIHAMRFAYAGLLPQLAACAGALIDPQLRWISLAAGFAYAALIFAFLGGVWWGMALSSPHPAQRAYSFAVAPSLISLVLFLPWTVGWPWPQPSLVLLAILIALSPLVDRALSTEIAMPIAWIGLRWHLSLCLAALTLALAFM